MADKIKAATAAKAAKTEAAADLELISAAAAAAGQIALGFFGHNPKVWIKEGDSPVSEADFAADRFLKETLLAARPDYGWISEETADERPPAAYQRYFIVDPIDGTRGFIEKNPQWCVSVAVVEAGRPLAGALDCPALGEHYTGIEAGAALLNGKPLRAEAARGQIPESSGEGQASESSGEQAGEAAESLLVSCRKRDFEHIEPEFAQQMRRCPPVPSLAYRLALLARGQVDAVLVRPGCHDWDIAAIDLILALSGGALADHAGRPIVYGRPSFSHGFLVGAKQSNLAYMLNIVSHSDLR